MLNSIKDKVDKFNKQGYTDPNMLEIANPIGDFQCGFYNEKFGYRK